jgi:hypothetical protein
VRRVASSCASSSRSDVCRPATRKSAATITSTRRRSGARVASTSSATWRRRERRASGTASPPGASAAGASGSAASRRKSASDRSWPRQGSSSPISSCSRVRHLAKMRSKLRSLRSRGKPTRSVCSGSAASATPSTAPASRDLSGRATVIPARSGAGLRRYSLMASSRLLTVSSR